MNGSFPSNRLYKYEEIPRVIDVIFRNSDLE